MGGGVPPRAVLRTILHTGLAANVAGDLAREPAAFRSQPKRTAEQANADDCDFLKPHAARIADERWRMEDCFAIQSRMELFVRAEFRHASTTIWVFNAVSGHSS